MAEAVLTAMDVVRLIEESERERDYCRTLGLTEWAWSYEKRIESLHKVLRRKSRQSPSVAEVT